MRRGVKRDSSRRAPRPVQPAGLPPATLPLGVRAALFEEATRRRAAEARVVDRLAGAGYCEVILPVLDFAAPYAALLGESGARRTYRFADRDGELLALRADSTPMVARLLAPELARRPLPLRVFYRGDVVRCEAPALGRRREFSEMGAELIGQTGLAADREVLVLAYESLAAAGVARPRVGLSWPGFLARLAESGGRSGGTGGGNVDALAEALARRDRGAARSAAAQAGLAGARLAFLERALEQDLDEGRDRRALADTPLAAPYDRLCRLAAALPEGAAFLDLAEPAGRFYYTGMLLRLYGGSLQPLGGGGRYDKLFGAFGAKAAAAGFSFGLERALAEGERT